MKYLETAELDLAALTPFPGNPRRGDVDAIRDSLRRNGQYRVIVVRRHRRRHTILAGNHTYLAASAEGRATIRADVVQCTDAEAARVVAWDNRGDDLARVDGRALLDVLGDLGDLDGTGITVADVDDLIAELEEGDAGVPDEGADHAGHYQGASTRAFVLEYRRDRFAWVEAQLARIREERGLDSNSAATLHVLAAVTGREAPA